MNSLPVLLGNYNGLNVWDAKHTDSLSGIDQGDVIITSENQVSTLTAGGLWGIASNPKAQTALNRAYEAHYTEQDLFGRVGPMGVR